VKPRALRESPPGHADLGQRCLQDGEQPFGGCRRLQLAVVVGPEVTQRLIELRGEQQDEEPLPEAQLWEPGPVRYGKIEPIEPKADGHRHQGDAQGREELEDRR